MIILLPVSGDLLYLMERTALFYGGGGGGGLLVYSWHRLNGYVGCGKLLSNSTKFGKQYICTDDGLSPTHTVQCLLKHTANSTQSSTA